MAEFRGKLYVFVDKQQDATDAEPKRESGDIFALRGPGEMLWYLTGWAVGRNERGSYCARTSPGKMRSFETFASAMDFVRKKRKNRPQESFYLVYEVDSRKSIITTLEHIRHLDNPANPTQFSADPVLNVQELGELAAKVGKIVAANALVLLKILTEDGEEAARARFSGATYDRLWGVLRDAALVKP